MSKQPVFIKIYKFMSFMTGSVADTTGRKTARYIVYILIVLLANIILGKNIGNSKYPWYANISVFLLLNINIILVLLLFIVLFRNIAKLIADRQKKIFGARLQTKLVIFSVILVTFPVLSTYFISSKLINNTINKWFDNNVYRTVSRSMEMVEEYMDYEKKSLIKQAENIALSYGADIDSINQIFVEKKIFDNAIIIANSDDYDKYTHRYPFLKNKSIIQSITKGQTASELEYAAEPYFWAGVPLSTNNGTYSILLIIKTADKKMVESTTEITGLYGLFKQLKFYSHPVKKAFNVSLFLISMLVIFACIWISMIFVRGIANPLKSLATAAGSISRGNLDTRVAVAGNDEITFLSKSFNYMASKLKEHTRELERKNIELNNALERISKDKMYIDIIYKNVNSALFLFDLNMNVLKANDIAYNLLLSNPKEIKELAETTLTKFIAGNENEMITQLNIASGTDTKMYSAHINKIINPEGKIENIMLVLDDNTNIINLQRIELWKEVATRIAHEIKNPLTPVKLTAERVKRRSSEIPVPQIKELVDNSMSTIIQEVDDLSNLVEEFNFYARVPSIVRTDVDIANVLHEVCNLYRKSTSININITTQPEVIIKGDRYQLKRVFTNLIQNALQAVSSQSGIVNVTSVHENNYAVITIIDNGAGITEEDLPKIFVPYFSKKPAGTGLGLAIVKKIIEEHEGKISVESIAGDFTKFTVKFPISDSLHGKLIDNLSGGTVVI